MLSTTRDDVLTYDLFVQPGRTEVVIVPNDGTRPRYEHLQTWTFKEGGKEWQNVEVSQFFPGGYITVVVARFPNGSPLPWPVRIYIDNHRSECPYNDVFQSVFQREWMGNVVIAKYSKTQTAKKRAFSATYERGETAWIMYAVAE